MDSERFDRLIRVFGQSRSRRQTLRGLAGVAAGVLTLGAREAAAGSRLGGATCDKPTQCASGKCLTSGKCSCSASVGCTKPANRCKQATCDTATKRCVNSNTAKGTACPDDGNPCTKNVCDGSGHCTHPDKKNGTTCSTCQAGPCACQDGTCQTCPPGQCGTCASGQTKCNEQCVDTQKDPAHCGGCGNACQLGLSCESGMCSGCPTGRTLCNDGCRNLTKDPDNCGSCGKVCLDGQVCINSSCTAVVCPAGSEYYCATQITSCPSFPSCTCATDIQGNTTCAKFGTPDSFCPRVRNGSECTQNADCGTGFVCIKATAPDCYNCGTIGGTSCEPVCA